MFAGAVQDLQILQGHASGLQGPWHIAATLHTTAVHATAAGLLEFDLLQSNTRRFRIWLTASSIAPSASMSLRLRSRGSAEQQAHERMRWQACLTLTVVCCR